MLESTAVSNSDAASDRIIPLNTFIDDFGDDLLIAVKQQNPPIYNERPDPSRSEVMDKLLRQPFAAQARVVQAVTRSLIDHDERASVINAEMGTGKSMMAICVAAVLHNEAYRRSLILSPPHLVFKWRREILETVPNARVWVLNGADTLSKLLHLRAQLGKIDDNDVPEFFILGRVRMRMGYHWEPVFLLRKVYSRELLETTDPNGPTRVMTYSYVACPDCGEFQQDDEGHRLPAHMMPDVKRTACQQCKAPLWTLRRAAQKTKSRKELVIESMCQIPTIGKKTAEKLVSIYGDAFLEEMLNTNVFDFINLMDGEGNLVFSDRKAMRMERSMANLEFAFGQGGYQPSEFIKRYLPRGYFSCLYVDEGHEYKNVSAQGQAMGVLATKVNKVILLTGTLMGGYATDLFYLLWRILGNRMREDGFVYNDRGSLGPASMSFMREHGVLIDTFKDSPETSHRTARGRKTNVRTSKGPGFGPRGIARYVLPYTVFLKLKDLGEGVLPNYQETLVQVPMSAHQRSAYTDLSTTLSNHLTEELRRGGSPLLGVVLNALLRWPDTCFRAESVIHPRTRALLHFAGAVFDEDELSPKEEEIVSLCLQEKAKSRRCLVYATYTGKHDVASRYKRILEQEGLKAAVLRSTVDTSKREDWIFDQVDRGIDVLICNPDLVKTGLDLLDFPTLIFSQTGFNVYTVQQASRRSWRIGQREDVHVYFLGYEDSAQEECLRLMAKKIAVSQSTSGEMPETGLEMLNEGGESIEVALARKLAA